MPFDIVQHLEQPFFPFQHLNRPTVPFPSDHRGNHTCLAGKGIGCILHVGQMSGHDAAQREVAAATDARRCHQLVDVEIVHASRHQWANELRERGVMPAHLSHAWLGGMAPTQFQFVGDEDGDECIFAVFTIGFGRGQRCANNIGGMAGILLPVDVVVIEGADEQAVHQGGVGGVRLVASADDGRFGDAAQLFGEAIHHFHIFVVHGCQGAAHAVEQETFGLVNRFGGDVVVLKVGCKFSHLFADGHEGIP